VERTSLRRTPAGTSGSSLGALLLGVGRVHAGLLGAVALGAAAGFLLLAGVTRASMDQPSGIPVPAALDATHLPPLLTAAGEPVELRYDVYCSGVEETLNQDDDACDAAGSVFVRTGNSGPFERLPLRLDAGALQGRWVAEIPSAIARSRDGFSYYAIFSRAGSSDLVLPLGGADAPQRSLPLGRDVVDVHLGHHVFDHARRPDARVAEAGWGDGPGDVGLEQGRNLPPIGGSSFDVGASGAVTLLDEAHRRLVRWSAGRRTPSLTPLAITGTIADLALASDGTAYILESAGAARSSVLRTFQPDGAEIGSGPTAGRGSEVRVGPDGEAVVDDQRSQQWIQVAGGGHMLTEPSQRRTGRAGRRLADGSEVVVLRRENEIRLALTGAKGARRSWRVTSDDPIAEVQLAEPLGRSLVVVVRVYTDQRDEFEVLVLGQKGLVRSFALDSAAWAETSPLSRFRLVGPSLYRLGSTPNEVFVDRFDLEVQ
jgi:hypothetical protein